MKDKLRATYDFLVWAARHGELLDMVLFLLFWLFVFGPLRALFGRRRG